MSINNESVEDIDNLTIKMKKLMMKVKLMDIRGHLHYMLLCNMLKKMKDSELMIKFKRKDWETS